VPFLKILKKREVDLALLLVAALWGSSYLATKVLTAHATVMALLAIRFSISSLALVFIWLVTRSVLSKETWALGLPLGSIQALIIYLETSGVTRTSATNVGLIVSLSIIFTPILESLASKKWLPRSFFVATTIAVLGVALLVSDKGLSAPSIGDWLLLGVAIIRSIHVTAMGQLTKGRRYSTIGITLVQSLVCALIFIVFAGSDTVEAVSHFHSTQWWGMLYLGVLIGAFSFLLTLWGIRRTSSSRVSLLLGTEPVWAVVIGIMLGGEKLLLIGSFGAVLIIGATYTGQEIERKARKNSSEI